MIQSVLDSANDAIDKQHLAAARADLIERVDDWKSLRVEQFGDLIRYGTYIVAKGETNKEPEREVCPPSLPLSLFLFYADFNQYHMYLFQKILLCCKDVNPNKQKAKLIVGKEKSPNTKGKPRLQLKGRIYMANISQINVTNRPGTDNPGPWIMMNRLTENLQAATGSRSHGWVIPGYHKASSSIIRTRVS